MEHHGIVAFRVHVDLLGDSFSGVQIDDQRTLFNAEISSSILSGNDVIGS